MSDKLCSNCVAKDTAIRAKDQEIQRLEQKVKDQEEVIKDLSLRLLAIEQIAKKERGRAQAEANAGGVPKGRYAFLKGQADAFSLILTFFGIGLDTPEPMVKVVHKINQFIRGGNYGK